MNNHTFENGTTEKSIDEWVKKNAPQRTANGQSNMLGGTSCDILNQSQPNVNGTQPHQQNHKSTINPYARIRKEKVMNNAEFQDQYQEYADQCAVENGDLYNTSAFERLLKRSPVFEPIDKLKQYEQRILAHALADLKHHQEWRDLEADDIRHGTTPGMYHMDATALLERYQAKIQSSYRAEQWYLAQIAECDTKIAEIKTWKTWNKSKANRLKHWTDRRIMLERSYATQTKKTDRYERLIYEWLGICDVIRRADIAREIAAERTGQGNKYGFNPNMQSRETATGVFED